jgi:N-acetylglucosaminyl-diphospho-decaprenol L-rhamnosyltransferase
MRLAVAMIHAVRESTDSAIAVPTAPTTRTVKSLTVMILPAIQLALLGFAATSRAPASLRPRDVNAKSPLASAMPTAALPKSAGESARARMTRARRRAARFTPSPPARLRRLVSGVWRKAGLWPQTLSSPARDLRAGAPVYWLQPSLRSVRLCSSRPTGPMTASKAHQGGGASPVVTTVIVNWNTGTCLRECLDALYSASSCDGVPVEAVVVDNASTDGSLDAAIDGHSTAQVIRNDTNMGFAFACNQGAACATGELLLFLNPDTRVATGNLATVVGFMRENFRRNVGICGVRLVDDDGSARTTAARFPSLRTYVGSTLHLSRWMPSIFPDHFYGDAATLVSRQVDHVSGAFFLVPRGFFEQMGGFDERYFVYYEEVDFARRSLDAGYGSWLVANTECYHCGMVSSSKALSRRLYYNIRSRTLYAVVHWSAPAAALLTIMTLVFEAPLRFGAACLRKGTMTPATVAVAYFMFVRWLLRCLWRRGNGLVDGLATHRTHD